jgi:hypothetical protein
VVVLWLSCGCLVVVLWLSCGCLSCLVLPCLILAVVHNLESDKRLLEDKVRVLQYKLYTITTEFHPPRTTLSDGTTGKEGEGQGRGEGEGEGEGEG